MAVDDLYAIETIILHAARAAAQGISRRLAALWPDEHEAETRQDPSLFDTFEHVVQFETACQLRALLVNQDRSWQYVSWEHRSSAGAWDPVDLVISADAKAADDCERLVVEIKWMTEFDGGLDGAASDALKLAWADARGRYLLLFGRCDPDGLIPRLEALALDPARSFGWDASRHGSKYLEQARDRLRATRPPFRLCGYAGPGGRLDAAVALVEVRYDTPLV